MDDSNSTMENMLEMGMGIMMTRQMMDVMSGCMQRMNASPSQPGVSQATSPTAPPPINKDDLQLYAVIDGNTAGPFCTEEVKALLSSGRLKQDSCVWKPGLAQWVYASQLPEINKLRLLLNL